jgi:hypothetical protein
MSRSGAAASADQSESHHEKERTGPELADRDGRIGRDQYEGADIGRANQ